MKRRAFITQTALGGASAAALGACSKQATSQDTASTPTLPRVEWRMATSWPEALDTIYGGAQTICQRVEEMTGGRFTIRPYAAGEIVGGLEVLDTVQSGAVECGHSASYYYTGKNSALAFGTAVPFGFTAEQQNAWLFEGGGLDAMRKIYADFNIINFPAGNTGTQMGGWFKRQINSVSELAGIKMRIPGMGGKVMSQLGVNVQVLPGGDIYLSLERGAIDAAEWVGPYDDQKLGLNRAADFYYYPGWWEPSATLEVLVNQAAWDRLPQDYQTIFATATYEANATMLARYNALNGQALTELVNEGTQLTAYSPEILTAAQKAAFELYENMASENSTFQAVYQSWKSFRDNIYAWHRTNELVFADFVMKEATNS